jgi:transcriptional regulator with XRE-family HTH domain
MASGNESTVRSRELGEAIRLAMERADLKGKRIADIVGWSETKVSRILTGHVPPSEVELSALLALCRVIGDQREYLLGLCREQAVLNRSTGRYCLVLHQTKAIRLAEFHNSLIPPLIQIDSYASALADRAASLEFDEIKPFVTLRQQAQGVIERTNPHPPLCTIFVHEQALRLPVGDTTVMSDQLHHILRMGERHYLNICIIPTRIGAYPGLGGPFCFMEFADFRPTVYIEDEVDGYFMEGSHNIAKYRSLLSALSAVAANAKDSKQIVNDVLLEYRD